MANNDLTISLTVNKSAAEVFDAINNVRGWWSSTLEGNSSALNDEFIYRYKDMHRSKQKLVELVPNKKIVWQVSDSMLSFIKVQDEWDGTSISFNISEKDGKTEILFVHHGLTPAVECFEACSGGWNHYLHKSLVPLINEGKGNPNLVP